MVKNALGSPMIFLSFYCLFYEQIVVKILFELLLLFLVVSSSFLLVEP